MKNLFLRYITGSIPFIALCTCGYAQNNELTDPITDLAHNNVKASRNMSATGVPATSINTKTVKNFKKNYKTSNAVSWFDIKDGILAEFKEDEITTKVFYDRKGNKTASIRSYFENKLPRDIRHQVKSHYYDFNIFYVQEVTVGDKTAYLVKIEDPLSFKTIRVVDGEMDELEAFTKSK